jgi:demethylmenaquinone methyltransferase / 2-methoxy-6-polyprenyl-1,4-benzoquinol methylase
VPVREKAAYVRRHFNSIADQYDFMNSLLSLGMHHLWKYVAVKSLGLKTGERVIDVCGGTADLSLRAARAVGPGGRVILCDINRAMIDAGRPKIGRASLGRRILCVQGDAEALPFPAGSFDAAMVAFGIRNLTHMDRGLAEMHRVLRPGGRMMCLECSLPVSAWFGLLYDFYSFCLMPLAGKLLAGNRNAYLHLSESIRRFPPPERIAALLGEVGFSAVAYRRLTNGIAVIYRGMKK